MFLWQRWRGLRWVAHELYHNLGSIKLIEGSGRTFTCEKCREVLYLWFWWAGLLEIAVRIPVKMKWSVTTTKNCWRKLVNLNIDYEFPKYCCLNVPILLCSFSLYKTCRRISLSAMRRHCIKDGIICRLFSVL